MASEPTPEPYWAEIILFLRGARGQADTAEAEQVIDALIERAERLVGMK